ncbi:MAG: hypothetical protein IJ484_02820 [Oscillospiraceae bacterium]|nr:hypothetical protein [Oscillospiraceae bacterium]
MKKLIALVLALVLALSLVACGGGAASSEAAGGETGGNPNGETIKIICGYGVGGTADLIARKYAVVANRLYPEYNFIVENMTGGDGFAAATYFADLDASAKELLVFGYGLCYRHDLGKEYGTEIVEFDRDAMYPIGTVDDRTWILYTTPDQTLESILEKAKAGTLKMSGGNPLSDCHLELGSLCALMGGNVMVVPYDGGAAQKQGLVNGEVDVFMGTTQAAMEEVEAGTLIPILAFNDRAFEGFVTPEGPITVPTVAGDAKAPELDPSIDFSSCILPAGGSLAVRAGADQAFIDAMTEVTKAVWADAEYHEWIESVMLNRFELYGDEAVAFYDEACAKAVAAFDNLSA